MLRNTKQSFTIMVMAFLVSFLGFSNFASADYAEYPVRPTYYGQWDGIFVDWRPTYDSNGDGILSADMDVVIWQQGIHAGQEADIVWKLYHTATGETVGYHRIATDFNGYITFDDVPSGDYQLTWVSKTNNDIEGSVSVPSTFADTYQ